MMKIIYILLGLFLLTSCGVLKDSPEIPENECNCDFTTAYIDGSWWILHPLKNCPPHKRQPDNIDWIIIH